ncbi:helix-turn-helix domain-containing protein [Tsukamurella sp. PLM1]|uniref:winged helix-turn-helix transcriptional regulator n=1 Tax=Tsukamurella sp. PLM1 TaxID=2929795 RepID=UPI0020692AB9|nr:helix-turn-helix domain-containing protein [Tsukamurella sp. PLM1]BDH58216.1 transcriptional regulator [Tsukamurella sp. PLM1]
MKDYNQYCPVALASAVIGERWTPLIVRELILGGRRFNDIDRGLPGISRSLLKSRLSYLERKGVVERVAVPRGGGHEYVLTPAGRDLERVIMALGEWSVRWMFSEPEPREVDPVTLTWWMSRRLVTDALPERRTVVEFDYVGDEPLRIWLVIERRESSVCTDPPGYDTDLVVRTDPVDLMRVFSGITDYPRSVATGGLVLSGSAGLIRSFPTWFAWSPFAPVVRERLAARGGTGVPRDVSETTPSRQEQLLPPGR